MSFGGVYVAATRQHVGKTSSSLGLVAGLQRIFTGKGVGFIKPMGQSHVEHVNDDGSKVLIDKDCPLFSDLLGCRGTPTDMSPLVVPRGYTKAFVDLDDAGRARRRGEELARIRAAHGRIADDSEFVVAEGTGHTAVGSILGLNNATLATGQEKGDSTSLQRECSARARFKNSTNASRALREMIARQKISRNERETTEIGAFEVGNFAPFSCPGSRPRWTCPCSSSSTAASARPSTSSR